MIYYKNLNVSLEYLKYTLDQTTEKMMILERIIKEKEEKENDRTINNELPDKKDEVQ